MGQFKLVDNFYLYCQRYDFTLYCNSTIGEKINTKIQPEYYWVLVEIRVVNNFNGLQAYDGTDV